MPNQQEWILVKDQKPPEETEVWLTTGTNAFIGFLEFLDGGEEEGYCYGVSENCLWLKDGKWKADNGELDDFQPLAWMPIVLPTPPKEKQKTKGPDDPELIDLVEP